MRSKNAGGGAVQSPGCRREETLPDAWRAFDRGENDGGQGANRRGSKAAVETLAEEEGSKSNLDQLFRYLRNNLRPCKSVLSDLRTDSSRAIV